MTDVMHSFDDHSSSISLRAFIGILVVTLLVGTGVGYLFTMMKKTTATTKATSSDNKKVVGLADKSTFKDQAEGILKEGGIEGEGNFHLERPGGVSQNVYLTSTTVDLSEHIGKKVRVWGATFKGEKAGWLMDVGLVEVLQ